MWGLQNRGGPKDRVPTWGVGGRGVLIGGFQWGGFYEQNTTGGGRGGGCHLWEWQRGWNQSCPPRGIRGGPGGRGQAGVGAAAPPGTPQC